MKPSEQILEYWFGSTELDHRPGPDQKALWFGKAESTDATIRERFSERLAEAAAGALDDWAKEPASLLALVLLLDQFPRHIHRGTAKMFAYDEQARGVCLDALGRELDRLMGHTQRTFLYLPLMHSERLADQDHSIRRYEALVADAPPELGEEAAAGLRFAHLHRDIIVRFGRYPHRNALLGRPSTPEELEFLTQPNSSF